MKYAISSDNGYISAHFGRAPEFTFVTLENGEVVKKEVLPNPGHTVGSIPEFVNRNGARCMITGGMGHRAKQFFNQYGIEVVTGVEGNIDEVINKILNGTLEGGESICKPGGGKGYGVDKIHTEADDNYPHNH
ncbi:MAG: NifB/NifX family molybdenum-iron cluster-binding protein [Candidatus Lokiarchaeota archaeon]